MYTLIQTANSTTSTRGPWVETQRRPPAGLGSKLNDVHPRALGRKRPRPRTGLGIIYGKHYSFFSASYRLMCQSRPAHGRNSRWSRELKSSTVECLVVRAGVIGLAVARAPGAGRR